jgi:hypothetical protein
MFETCSVVDAHFVLLRGDGAFYLFLKLQGHPLVGALKILPPFLIQCHLGIICIDISFSQHLRG